MNNLEEDEPWVWLFRCQPEYNRLKEETLFRRILGFALIFLILAGTLYQGGVAARSLTALWRNKVWANRQLDAVARSADVAFGGRFSKYIVFLDEAIPEDATVVIPSNKQGKFELHRVGLMQYFLFPRKIRNCSKRCASLLSDPGTFIVAYGEFPPRKLVPSSKQYRLFGGNLGLYVPEEGEK